MKLNSNAQTLPKLPTKRMRNTRIFIACCVPMFLLTTPYLNANSMTRNVMTWLGFLLIMLCVFGRIYCALFIGGKKNNLLINDGPFTVVRNPLYVFSFIGIVGLGLLSGMLTLLVSLIIIFCVYYSGIVSQEEQFLLARFGNQYEDYRRAVPRWFPRTLKLTYPETVVTSPHVILRTIRDSSLFFLAYPAFTLIEKLHYLGIIPKYLLIP